MGEMRRIERENREREKQDRFASTIVIPASIIAASGWPAMTSANHLHV